MNLSDKLAALEKIYAIYDKFSAALDSACKKYCAHCCTTSVTLTTIEAYKIIMGLESSARAEWIGKILQVATPAHRKPKITTNQLADLCAQGLEPLEEERTGWASCHLLTDNQCPLYAVRPFGCRCLMSRHNCGQQGYADMDDFVFAVNTVFLQAIEHLDADGCSGNLLDVLGVMAVKKNRQAYAESRLGCAAAGLMANHPLKVLMIPPEHRSRMEPILNSLREIRI